MGFREKLIAAQARNNSWLCIGLDPDPAHIPPGVGLADFCGQIIDATADLCCALKPNLAFFLVQGSEGIKALEAILKKVPADLPVVLDAKAGDIGSTQHMIGQAAFDRWGVDALTVSPYIGDDAIVPLLEGFPGKGLFIVCRSSNRTAPRFQDHPGASPKLYETVAQAAIGWAEAYPASVVGLVAGATYPQELAQLRQQAPRLPFLIPGVGAQGGELKPVVERGATADGIGPLISISRAIMYASGEPDFAQAARAAAIRYRDEINHLRG